MNRPTRRIMTGLLVLLTCPALSTHPLASDSAVEKLLLLSADTEAVFSPGVVDGRNDVLTLDARFAVRLTDALRSLESGPSGSSDTQFFVEWEWTILALDGVTPFTTLRRLEPILPPYVMITIPGDSNEYVLVSGRQVWYGRDSQGIIAPDGLHTFNVTARTVRIDTPGHAASEGVTAPREIESLAVHATGSSINLTWDAVTSEVFGNASAVVGYNIYRDVRPDFVPDTQGGTNRMLFTAGTEAMDADGISASLYYIVTAVDAANEESGVQAKRKEIDGIQPFVGEVLVDDVPPVVLATVDPPPNSNGWTRSDVTITYSCTDVLSGVFSCPPPVTVTGNSVDQLVTRSVMDLAGNTTTVSVRVRIDRIPPVPAPPFPAPCPASIDNERTVVKGCFNDLFSGIDPVTLSLTVDGVNRTFQSVVSGGCISWTPTENFGAGDHSASATASDRAFNSSSVAWCFRIGTEVPTTVVGTVLDENGGPAAGAEVTVQIPVTPPPRVLAGLDGRFSISGVATHFGDLTVLARLEREGEIELGQSAPTLAVPGGTTNVGTIHLRSADPTKLFAGPMFDVGVNPNVSAGADFNGDGRMDLVVANRGSNDVSILLGRDTGTFAPQTRFAVGTHPESVVVGDFNEDGTPDVVTGNPDSGDISVLLGVGDGTLNAQARFAVTTLPYFIATADFNMDGHLDLALGGGGIVIMLGHGDGTFASEISLYPAPASGLAVGDVNRDGRVDIVAVNVSSGFVLTLLNNGGGTFTAQRLTSTFIFGATLADFNNDGKLDLVTMRDEADAHLVMILLGNGVGGFAGGSIVTAGARPVHAAAGDFDHDGNQDLAIANADSSDVSILRGRGDGTFEPQVRLAAGTSPRSIVVGDFNNDGKADLTAANFGSNGVAVLIGHGDGAFVSRPLAPAGQTQTPGSPVVGDFNSDGLQDLAMRSFFTSDAWIFPGRGDGTFQSPARFHTIDLPDLLRAGDFNGDGNLDLVAARSKDLSILLGLGDGTMAPEIRVSVPSSKTDVLVADLNKDGLSDLIVPQTSNQIAILLSRGDGTFYSAGPITMGPAPHAFAVGDFDGDGTQDLAASNFSNDISIYLGRGDGTFVELAPAPVQAFLRGIAVADFNEDGRADLAGSDQEGVWMLPGNGDGTFGPGTRTSAAGSFGVIVGDFNRDGHHDLAALTAGSIRILPGRGDGTFSAQARFATGLGAPAIGDLNGDGWEDIVLTWAGSTSTLQLNLLQVMLNQTPFGP